MEYVLIDGKSTARSIEEELAEEVSQMREEGLRAPTLAAVLVGGDPASETYVGHKMKACERVGINSQVIRRPSEISEDDLLEIVNGLNDDKEIDGFIVQLPLPKHIDEQRVIEAVDPTKDVDGFHPINQGKMLLDLPGFQPATPAGIVELIRRYGIETEGKHCVVLGRSHIVGTPMSVLMSRNSNPGNCTVTITHSRTRNLEEITRQADILISALGKPGFISGDMVKDGVAIIDVGTTRVEDPSKKRGFRLSGDVDFESVAPKSSYITPVPGGVGPMTIASLLTNCLHAARSRT